MAEEKEKEETAEAPAPKAKGKAKKIIFVVLGLLVLVAGIGVPLMMFRKSSAISTEEVDADAAKLEDKGHVEGADDEDELADGEDPIGAIIPFDTFVVNLPDNKFARVQIQVEFTALEVPRRFYVKLVPLRDAIISLLTQKNPQELMTTKGKDSLRSDIKDLMNETLKKEDVKRVYFTQFVIQ